MKNIYPTVNDLLLANKRIAYDCAGISLSHLDSLFLYDLNHLNVYTSHVLELIDLKTGEVIESTVPGYISDRYTLTTKIDTLGIMGTEGIRVRLENPDKVILQKMTAIIVSSLLLFLLLVGAFVYLLRTIFLQKKYSDNRDENIHSFSHDIANPAAFVKNALYPLYNAPDGYCLTSSDRNIMRLCIKKLTAQATLASQMNFAQSKAPIDIRPVEFDLREEMEDLALIYNRTPVDGKIGKINLSYELSRNTIVADKIHFVGAVENLIKNGVKYSLDPVIEVRCYEADGNMCISVKDNGVGIAEKFQAKIFENHFRIKEVRNATGYGMGLRYVQKVIKAHDGNIRLQSVKDQGSEFTILIPIK